MQRGSATFCNRASLLIFLAILAFSKRRKSVKSTSSRVRDEFMSRKQPNILVTGTPGTGKTTTCQQVVEAVGFTYINVGDWVKQHELHSGWDEEHDCYIIDEDKVCWVPDNVLHISAWQATSICVGLGSTVAFQFTLCFIWGWSVGM